MAAGLHGGGGLFVFRVRCSVKMWRRFFGVYGTLKTENENTYALIEEAEVGGGLEGLDELGVEGFGRGRGRGRGGRG